jgi:hypothetical protein
MSGPAGPLEGIMRGSSFITTAVVIVAVLALAVPAAAQERVAQLSEVDGTVTITRAADGAIDEARQVGPRVHNGSVFGGDVVTTGAGATATLVFTDGSEVKLKESSSLSVREVDFSKLMAAGQADKPLGRVIQVTAGDIWTRVVPNPDVATQFETPSGVAAVRGTVLTISVDGDAGQATE